MKSKTVEFEILKDLGTIGDDGNYKKKVAIVKWGNNDAKVDIRRWADNGTPLKGITLTMEESRILIDALGAYLG